MSDSISVNGSCLCSAVTMKAEHVHPKVGACHCSMCRKWAGGPLMTTGAVENISFRGEENIQTFSSSDWAERGFCKQCGTHLFYRLKQNAQYFLPLGLIDGNTNWDFDHQVFIDEKPAFYDFANQTHKLTGQEVFEAFNSAD